MREEYQGSHQRSSIQGINLRKNKKYISNKGSYFLAIFQALLLGNASTNLYPLVNNTDAFSMFYIKKTG